MRAANPHRRNSCSTNRLVRVANTVQSVILNFYRAVNKRCKRKSVLSQVQQSTIKGYNTYTRWTWNENACGRVITIQYIGAKYKNCTSKVSHHTGIYNTWGENNIARGPSFDGRPGTFWRKPIFAWNHLGVKIYRKLWKPNYLWFIFLKSNIIWRVKI